MSSSLGLFAYLGLGLVGGALGAKLKIPAGALIGAMLTIILFKMTMKMHWEIPKGFTFALQVFLGIMVGATFQPELPFQKLLFETVSAFGTVGLSLGITPGLALSSKIVIMATMFVGRIGPLTLLIALSRRESRAQFQYPEENIMIG